MPSIRPMTLNDLAQVAKLDALAFNTTLRNYRHLKASLHLNPAGCFVATTTNGEPIGYAFSRIWGCLGWIGVLGVRPDHQGKGFGKTLVRTTIKHLQDAGCKIIGLATEAQKPNDVGLYIHLGFLPGFPTLELSKTTEHPQESLPFIFLSQLNTDTALKAVRQISQEVKTGLDYTSEASNAYNYQWGETLFFGWPQPWAFAIVRTSPTRESSDDKVMQIAVLAIPKDARKRLPEVLRTIEELASYKNYSQICIAVNASDPNTLQQVVMSGFRVRNLLIPMTLDHPPEAPTGIDLSRWIM